MINQLLNSCRREPTQLPVEDLLEQRYQKFRKMGVFDEGATGEAAAAGNQ